VRRWVVLLGVAAAGLYLYYRRAGGIVTPPEGRELYWDAVNRRYRTAPEVGAMVTAFLDTVPDPPSAEERRVLSYFLTIERAARSFRIEPALIAAIIARESGGFADVTGTVGEVGLMQVRPTTADFIYGLGLYRGDRANLHDPEINTRYGGAYLRWQMDQYADRTNRIRWAVAGYNAGTASYDPGSGKFANEVYVSDVVDYRLPRYAYLFNQVYRRFGQ